MTSHDDGNLVWTAVQNEAAGYFIIRKQRFDFYGGGGNGRWKITPDAHFSEDLYSIISPTKFCDYKCSIPLYKFV